MNRTALALLAGILLGIIGTFVSADLMGGWYAYEIRPTARCYPETGATVNLENAQPVPGQTHPCLFRRPRFAILSH